MTDRFSGIVGHHLPIALLKASLQKDRIAPAYLFLGKEGIGKTLTAIAFVESFLNRSVVNHPDVLLVEPTYQEKGKLIPLSEATGNTKGKAQIRIEQIRSITDFLSHPPLYAPRSFVIMTDAHLMTETSANALLKTLEEPGRATILLISAQLLMPTILSRCQIIPFAPLARTEVRQILDREGFAQIPDQVIDLAQGSPQTAIEAWQNLQTIPPELLENLRNPPLSLVSALPIAKQISQELDLPTQLWLLDYLQLELWQKRQNIAVLEQAKQWLQAFVSPRLVWEVTLINLGVKSDCSTKC